MERLYSRSGEAGSRAAASLGVKRPKSPRTGDGCRLRSAPLTPDAECKTSSTCETGGLTLVECVFVCVGEKLLPSYDPPPPPVFSVGSGSWAGPGRGGAAGPGRIVFDRGVVGGGGGVSEFSNPVLLMLGS